MLLLAGVVQGTELKPLDDTELAAISGREGVAMDFTYAMNAYETDKNGHSAGDPLSSLGDCSGQHNPCSLGITVNNRPGLWVMLKDLYGIQKINNFWLNGRETRDVNGVASLADPNRFIEMEGGTETCQLPGRDTSNCLASSPNSPSLPSLAMQYGPASGDGFDTFEVDVEWHLYIGRVNVQYDDNNSPAYLPANDKPGSFMSYQITDMHQNAAKFDYDGSVVMYGW